MSTIPQAQCGRCGERLTPRAGLTPRFCPRCGSQLAPPASPATARRDVVIEPGKVPGAAIASLVVGLVGFFPTCFPAGPVAIILGVMARGRIAASHGRLGGRGFATAGMVLGIITSSIWLLVCAGAIL